MPDETKLAVTNGASHGSATSKTFGAVKHCSLLLVLSSLFVDHPSLTVALHEPVRFSNSCSLRRSRSPAQVNVGIRRASKVVTERYEGLWRSKANHFSIGDFDQLDGVGDRPHIVISGVSYAPNAILMIRDLLRGKLLFRSHPSRDE
jgi:hypothetical protein